MRFLVFVCVMLAIAVPALLMGETLYLTDGSTLRGKLKKYENDTLYFETAFGANVTIPKHKVVRIDFDETGAVSPPLSPGTETLVPGTLQVAFENVKFTTRINVKRDRNREAVERENSIEQRLLVGNKLVFSYIDSVTDKVIRNGPETTLNNDFVAQNFAIVLDADLHHLTLEFGNTLADQYVSQFDDKPLERTLLIDNVTIEPGKTSRIRVGMKRKRFGLTKSELYVVK
ncbi:MAG: hypothetical protein JSW50_07400 [Candidatus Latescibacterota bacterium]|nr:MAG: hypothetical protein JSW50_07400 [Candidatus Latescibacterota bacterium]